MITVSDGVDTHTETITITVTNTNRAPTADDQTLSTPQNTPVTITSTGSDPDGDTLSYTIDTPPTDGVLSGTAPDLIYTPNPRYIGPDSFTFTVSDGTDTSTPATVSITISEVPSELSPLLLKQQARDVLADGLN